MQGGAVVRALLHAGNPVTAFVRDPASAPAQALVDLGATLAVGDLDDTASLNAASVGHDAVFSMQTVGMNPEDPEAEQRQARNIATAAAHAGVTQLLHTSVSATGWRAADPEAWEEHRMADAYWDQKEAAEEEIRKSGVTHWTIFKPALYMENFLTPRRDYAFPDLVDGKVITAAVPDTVMAFICADDLGTAVAAAVADPNRFHEAEIEMAGDALTFTEVAEVLTKATGREITAVFASFEEQSQRIGAPTADSQVWHGRVGYPARPQHVAEYGVSTTTLEQWAARQDWSDLTA